MSWTSLCTIARNDKEAILEVATKVPILSLRNCYKLTILWTMIIVSNPKTIMSLFQVTYEKKEVNLKHLLLD